MACIEVFAAGECLARTAGSRTGIVDIGPGGVLPFAAWRNPVTTSCFTYWNGYTWE